MVCLLEPGDTRELPANCERVPFTGDRYYQAGQFLPDVPGLAEDDLLIMADADAVVQRDWEPEELELMRGAKGVCLGYNMRQGQQGRHELEILQPKLPLSEVGRQVKMSPKTLEDCPMYNTGLMSARVSVWRNVLRLYEEHAGGVMARCHDIFFCYPSASMQYFICCVLSECGVPVTEFGYVTHSHGHFGLPEGSRIEANRLYYRDRLVFFAHFSGITSCE